MKNVLLAKSAPDWTSLKAHTQHVCLAVNAFAEYLGMNPDIAKNGAILHDIGKAHTYFQTKRLKGEGKYGDIFRHEIASLFSYRYFLKNNGML